MPVRGLAEQTARLLAMRRSLGLVKRRRRPVRLTPPKMLDREYFRELDVVVDETRRALEPVFQALPGLETTRTDADEGRRLREALAAAAARLGQAITPERLESLAARFALRVARFHRSQFRRHVEAALGADVFTSEPSIARAVDGFVMENVALIKSLPASTFTDIEKLVSRGVASGRRHEDMARDIQERFGATRKRAMLVARDQVGKLYGQINKTRLEGLGVEEYIWRSVNDSRVRPHHASRDGERFKWTEPPDDGHPGEPINCRCYAEPVFDSILKDG